ncbi:MAG: branched-chain amino acid ABC transporter permease [Alphaproteobacteria bacterium]|nr:branched-chain amino acid ABC transporter permease [Alphaproteobacteria bacterium]
MDLALQLLVNGLINGSHYALLGIGWGLIFGPTRVVHFAYGPIYALSAYAAWGIAGPVGLGLIAGLVGGALVGAALGVASYLGLYRPFEREGASPLTVLIASLGLFIVLENAIGIIFGTENKVAPGAEAAIFLVGPVVVTGFQLAQVAALVVLGGALAWYLGRTRAGQAILAMTDNGEMARIVGIDTGRVSIAVFAIGSALAGIAAGLVLFKEGATPHMGFIAVFMAFVAVIVGGIGSLRGAALGGLILGVVESLGMWKIPTEWQSTIAFGVLFVVLLVRPTGLYGKK